MNASTLCQGFGRYMEQTGLTSGEMSRTGFGRWRGQLLQLAFLGIVSRQDL